MKVVVEKALKTFLRKPKRRKQRVKMARPATESGLPADLVATLVADMGNSLLGVPRCPTMFGPGVQCTQVVGHSGDHST